MHVAVNLKVNKIVYDFFFKISVYFIDKCQKIFNYLNLHYSLYVSIFLITFELLSY